MHLSNAANRRTYTHYRQTAPYSTLDFGKAACNLEVDADEQLLRTAFATTDRYAPMCF